MTFAPCDCHTHTHTVKWSGCMLGWSLAPSDSIRCSALGTRQRWNLSTEPRRDWLVGRTPSSQHPYLIISSCRDLCWLTCCLRDVAEPCFASEAALSAVPLSSSTAPGSSALVAADPRSSSAASSISKCLHLSTSSSSTPASVALRRSPMRTRSVPDQSEFTQPRRPAILVAVQGRTADHRSVTAQWIRGMNGLHSCSRKSNRGPDEQHCSRLN